MRRVGGGRRKLLALFLLLASTGCLGPEFFSIPMGVQMPRPENAGLMFDAGAVYLYSDRQDWSIVLTVRKPPPRQAGGGLHRPQAVGKAPRPRPADGAARAGRALARRRGAARPGRLYRLHLMTKPASEAAAFQAWGEVIAGIRFTGRPVVGIPGGENVPVGTVADLVRGGVLGDSAAPLLR